MGLEERALPVLVGRESRDREGVSSALEPAHGCAVILPPTGKVIVEFSSANREVVRLVPVVDGQGIRPFGQRARVDLW